MPLVSNKRTESYRRARWRISSLRAIVLFRVMVLLSFSAAGFAGLYGQMPSTSAPAATAESGEIAEFLRTGRFKEAEAVLRETLATQPDLPDARYLLAYALLRENRATESLAEYTAAAKLRPPSAADLKNVAMNYVLLESYPDADRWIGRSIAMDPSDADAWYVHGRIEYESKRYVAAADDFKKVLELAPRTVKAEDNLGLAYEALNRADEAAAAYRQAIEWQRGSSHPSEQPLLNLAVLLIHQNDLDQALPLLVQAAAIAPLDSRIHEQIGQLYLKQDRPGEAQKEFESAIAASPDKAALHFLLGQAYRRQGMQEQAKAELARAAALSGTHSSAN